MAAFACNVTEPVLSLVGFHLSPELLVSQMGPSSTRKKSPKSNGGAAGDGGGGGGGRGGGGEDNNGDGGIGEALAREFGADLEDPRGAVTEAYVLLLKRLILEGAVGEPLEAAVARTVFACTLDWMIGGGGGGGGGEGEGAPRGMSYDDSCTLCILDLFSVALKSAAVLEKVGAMYCGFVESLAARGYDLRSAAGCSLATRSGTGAGMVMAALFSGASGRMPPWALEFIPASLRAIAAALGGDPAAYRRCVDFAIDCRVAARGREDGAAREFWLSGRFIGKQKELAKEALRGSFGKCLKADNWKDMKNALKVACGGKKKNAGFKLKPSLRRFENTRV